MKQSTPENFMGKALLLAKKAASEGEVPVGCVIVRDGVIISRGRNRREKGKNALLHAEIEAISKACKKLGGWRLSGCELYVTLEPCPMCAGAIINSRLDSVYFGAADPKAGAVCSKTNLFELGFNHRPNVYSGILGSECADILSVFFQTLRREKHKKINF